ncbi:MAG: prepilin-type N-terminal cleavage/methylation domain-containing protein [Coriobacteriia bacterium]|nr:prepilin-type N-terminal cleavage/methylation domain-containing protein [Coriobacteriia bacterium]
MKDNRGFTLAELLIVVAIVLVLVAIAIPVFTSQLEKSREATDEANIRSAYAELKADVLAMTYEQTIADDPDHYVVQLEQLEPGWQTTDQVDESDDPFANVAQIVNMPGERGTATLTYDAKDEKGLKITYDGASGENTDPTVSIDPMGVLFDAFLKNPLSVISCFDSTYPNANSIIDKMNKTLAADPNFSKDVKTWCIINPGQKGNFGTADNIKQNASQLYYMWTTVDITDKRGQNVPVVMSHKDANGNVTYTVGQVKVTKGDTDAYNVIERDANGTHPKSQAYNINTVIIDDGDKKEFTDYKQASAYLDKLVAKRK